jgi:TonB family protein
MLCWIGLALIAATCGHAASTVQAQRDSKHNLLVAYLDTVTITITLTPFESQLDDPGRGIRSVLLYVSKTMFVEPSLRRADGSYVNGHARISNEEMLRVLDVLGRDGFFTTAETYHSERAAKPEGPPPASKHIRDYLDRVIKPPVAEVRLNFFDANCYTEYIILPSWDKQLAPLLTELQRTISDPAAKQLLAQLLATATRTAPPTLVSCRGTKVPNAGAQACQLIFTEDGNRKASTGKVLLEITVLPNGTVDRSSVRILRRGGYGMDEPAVEMVRTWQYTPAQKDGIPVAANIQVEVHWRP